MGIRASDGTMLHVEDVGDGDPIVFLHEFAGDAASLRGQLRHFGTGYRCIAFNARGFDPSSAPESAEAYSLERAVADLRDVLDASGVHRCHVVGLSLGAATALGFALDHPERVGSLVLVSWGYGMDVADNAEFRRQSQAGAELIESGGMGPYVEAYGRSPVRDRCRTADPVGFDALMTRMAARSAIGSALTLRRLQAVRQPLDEALRGNLHRLAMPVSIITGDEDEPSYRPSLDLASELAGARLSIMREGGHTLYLEQPAALNGLIDDHLRAAGSRRATLARDPGMPDASEAA